MRPVFQAPTMSSIPCIAANAQMHIPHAPAPIKRPPLQGRLLMARDWPPQTTYPYPAQGRKPLCGRLEARAQSAKRFQGCPRWAGLGRSSCYMLHLCLHCERCRNSPLSTESTWPTSNVRPKPFSLLVSSSFPSLPTVFCPPWAHTQQWARLLASARIHVPRKSASPHPRFTEQMPAQPVGSGTRRGVAQQCRNREKGADWQDAEVTEKVARATQGLFSFTPRIIIQCP